MGPVKEPSGTKKPGNISSNYGPAKVVPWYKAEFLRILLSGAKGANPP
jgi:hypothetical protein